MESPVCPCWAQHLPEQVIFLILNQELQLWLGLKSVFSLASSRGYLKKKHISDSLDSMCDLMWGGSNLHELPWQKSGMQTLQGCCDSDSHTRSSPRHDVFLHAGGKHSDRHSSRISQMCWIEF